MARFRKLPVEIEATQWFKLGDHDVVTPWLPDGNPDLDLPCKGCSKPLRNHGFCQTLEGGHVVCPRDWIITGIKGEHYPCKPDIFAATCEAVE